MPPAGKSLRVGRLLSDLKLETVCAGARCPNKCECFSRGTAAFLILGEKCTRDCRFCAVPHGEPAPAGEQEPEALAQAAAELNLRHVVITSVTRDDLADGGARQFAQTLRAVRRRLGEAILEVLTPDFLGKTSAVETVLAGEPDVFNHNVETVPRLYPAVRPQADYRRSIELLAYVKRRPTPGGRRPLTKSGIMLGLGECDDEIRQVLADLRQAEVDMLTIGQYLAPSPQHVPIARFARPDEFAAWKTAAMEMGFIAVAAGPYVRSSYDAEGLFQSVDSTGAAL